MHALVEDGPSPPAVVVIASGICAILAFKAPNPWLQALCAALCAIFWLIATLYRRLPQIWSQRLTRLEECRRLIADCDEQDAALLAGDEVLGTFGRFRP